MITKENLKNIARARIKDAKVLYQNDRYDGAEYLFGYAVEIALKARICEEENMNSFPATNSEFQGYQQYKTHDLDNLLEYSGMEEKIKTNYFVEWSEVTVWEPSARYKPIGYAKKEDTNRMIKAARTLVRVLWSN